MRSVIIGGAPLPPSYHREKSELAKSHGFRCIHVFDWDDVDKVIQFLLPTEPIYARSCKCRDAAEDARLFEDKFHIQGSCNGQSVCLGLYSDNELTQLATFGRPRYNSNYEWELLRLCTRGGYRVVGGAERLLKHFVSEYNPQSIISYCDLAKFTGDVYTRIGFDHVRNNAPGRIWSRGTKKITDALLNSRGYDQLFGTSYGKGTSNEQLMIESGWLPVYDCGQAVYVWQH